MPGADVRLNAEQVEAQRQYLLEEAKKVKMQQRELERSRVSMLRPLDSLLFLD